MKTGQEFFDMLTKEEQDKWTEAYQNDRSNSRFDTHIVDYLSDGFVDMIDFLGRSFAWHATPQGLDYWFDLVQKYERRTEI